MVSPLLTTPVTQTSGNKSVRCTCRCHFCHRKDSSRSKFSTGLSSSSKITVRNEVVHREYCSPMLDLEGEMTSHSPMLRKERITSCCSRSSSSSSLSSFRKGLEKCGSCEKISGTRETVNATGINCKSCETLEESLSRDEMEQTSYPLLHSSSSGTTTNGCERCEESGKSCGGSSVTGTNNENCRHHFESETNCDHDKDRVLKTWKNYHCSDCSSDSVYSSDPISTRYFRNKTADKGDNPSKPRMTWGEKEGRGMRRLTGLDRRVWLLCASLLFLSFVGSTCSYSVFDDEDDDFGVGVSHYARYRRSAEQFSSLHDALSLIPSNYSIHEPPPTNNSEATQVDFSVLIMNVRDIKELNEGYGDLELSLEMNLRIYWKDTRLSHLADRSGNKFIVLNPILLDKLWHPDIFIDHVKGVAQPALISKPASLRVYPDSSVRYSARITVTMACQMDFHYYPADTQRCSVDMKSYAYSSKILALDWREGKGALLVEYLELPNFDVALDTTQNFMVNTSSGSYSGIRFTILLRRKLSYHLIQTYLPSTLFIIVSWLSFLVPPESVPGRMALCMTTLLTLTAMFSAVRQNTPNVSYVKALDIWMVVCIIFVFLTLVEYTVLLKLKSKKSKPRPPVPMSAHPPERTTTSAQTQHQPPPPTTRWTIPSLQYTSDSAKFRGCKNTDGVISENGSGTNGEMRHRESGGENGAASGDSVNINTMNIPPAPPPSAHPPPLPSPPPPPPPMPLGPGDRPLNKYELAAKKIEKFTSAVIPTLFVIFQFIYWPWLINSSEYYNQDKSTTIFKSM